MSEQESPMRWHESLASVVMILVFGAILTAPCWAFVLLVLVMSRG